MPSHGAEGVHNLQELLPIHPGNLFEGLGKLLRIGSDLIRVTNHLRLVRFFVHNLPDKPVGDGMLPDTDRRSRIQKPRAQTGTKALKGRALPGEENVRTGTILPPPLAGSNDLPTETTEMARFGQKTALRIQDHRGDACCLGEGVLDLLNILHVQDLPELQVFNLFHGTGQGEEPLLQLLLKGVPLRDIPSGPVEELSEREPTPL